MRPQPDETLIRRYLLGDLPETEANSLEQQYFTDGDAFERVWAAENELVDDYVARRLAAEDRARFERHYLASPPHRERVATARALRDARVVPRPRTAAVVGWSVAAALVLALGAWIWPSRSGEGPRTAMRPTEPSPTISAPTEAAPDASVIVRPPAVVALALSPILVRGSGSAPTLRIPRGTEDVLLQLEGDPAASGAGRLTAAVRTVEGQTIFEGEVRAASPDERRSLIGTVRVPAARLLAGDYILTLSAVGASGQPSPVHRYYFRVVG